MIREEFLRRLVDESYIDLFLAGVDGARLYWPWRMARKGDSLSTNYRNSCEVYWVDSAIQDPSYGNQDVLDDAHRVNAEAALLADTMGEFEETVEAVKEGIELAKSHPFDGEIIIPMQAPYDRFYNLFPGFDTYAIGGLNQAPTAQRIKAAKQVRDLAGDEAHIHGLGWGPDEKLITAIHNDPGLLDSIDYSTPLQNSVGCHSGDERLSVVAGRAGAKLIEDLRMLTPHVEVETETHQDSLTGWA